MIQPDRFAMLAQIKGIESLRRSRVLVLSASDLDMEILPALYEQCRAIGRVPRLDVVLQCRGGIVNAARRIALLLRQFTDHLGVIVPYHCESSATILALAADDIIAGDLAMFSPIDPHLHGGDDDGAASSLSCQDIKMFGAMSEEWFGVSSDEARLQSLGLLCNSIFPPTLTAFYRTTREVMQIGEELLRFQLPGQPEAFRQDVVRQLMFGYHSHNYALTREELEKLGLAIRREPDVEECAWAISKVLQKIVGGGLRESAEAPWNDALLATRDGAMLRKRRSGGFLPRWSELAVSS
ncbi:hypothetical protein LXA47_06700 [Massilia sp. P8910]|uniref:SDH family Clp fold serine proteinase n=1 Tax=Massilia antarctica TaxID=2765360 RepID=UPI0006BB7EEB|nr:MULTISPECIES: hypothetical protein [Massilia]MCE3603297.1 hypothetical protein [Massilia antarctica]MCY0913439.1 hypothetical protein [Massilia sp. H27-R4]CUI09575.1 hypothetical protein BN2497_13927 [Janthinobacterium sp. CG23_2]CUU33361.1 hypothetical protein BN3177_13927 [Janthinobacterium sp. CG23_2]